MDGASQALLEVQEGGAGTEAAPQRGDPLCRPAGREHLLTTEYWKHFKPLAIKPLAILNLWQPLHISTSAFEETVPLFGFYGCHGAHSAWRTQLGEECASGGRAGLAGKPEGCQFDPRRLVLAECRGVPEQGTSP